VAVNGLTNPMFGSTGAPAALRRSLADAGSAAPLQAEYVRVMQRAIGASALLQTALPGVNVPAIPATPIVPGSSSTLDKDPLARQLRMVAAMIGAGPTLGMRRQVFMVSMGGFDTHANQVRDQPALTARVAQSVDYFLQAMTTMGLLDNVLLFTASDFGRTLLSNGQGSDHGWGSHHIVAGGAVRGRNVYGRFPSTALGSADDVGSGRLLPATSVTEYAASLGRWMGLSGTELASVLPNVGNFSQAGVGFV
jgi:uncharacterized protein (DUF1501 family)